MKRTAVITKFQEKDATDIARLIRLASKEGAFRPFSRITQKDVVKYVRNSAFGEYQIFVLKVNDKVNGYIDFYEMGGVGIILGICVFPSQRNHGFGSQLLSKCLKRFKESHCHKIKTEVYSYNKRSINFFMKNRFTVEAMLSDDEFHRNLFVMSMRFTNIKNS